MSPFPLGVVTAESEDDQAAAETLWNWAASIASMYLDARLGGVYFFYGESLPIRTAGDFL